VGPVGDLKRFPKKFHSLPLALIIEHDRFPFDNRLSTTAIRYPVLSSTQIASQQEEWHEQQLGRTWYQPCKTNVSPVDSSVSQYPRKNAKIRSDLVFSSSFWEISRPSRACATALVGSAEIACFERWKEGPGHSGSEEQSSPG